MRYRTEIDLSDARLDDIDPIVELVRMVGYPDLDLKGRKLGVVFEVAPEGAAEDLWDLRSVCEELEANLSSYLPGPMTLAKPINIDVGFVAGEAA